MSGIELWYDIHVFVRDAQPVTAGPVRLQVAGTENPEMALELLQEELNGQWSEAVQDNRLWEVLSNVGGFVLINPVQVVGVNVVIIPKPEQAGAPDQPATGGTVSHLEDKSAA